MLWAAVVAAAFAGVWWATLNDRLALGWGFLAVVVLDYLMFTPLHEASHGNVGGHRRPWLDTLFGHLAGWVMFASFSAFRTLHLRHHAHTNDPSRDPDHWVAGRRWWAVALRCLSIFPRYYTMYFGSLRAEGRIPRGQWIEGVGMLAGQLLVAAALSAAGLWAEVLALWVLPSLVASGCLALALDWIPHHPHEARGRYVDTRVVLAPGLGPLLMAHHVHAVHHLYPRVPFYRYERLFHEIRSELEANGTPIVDLRPAASREGGARHGPATP
jgi:beta-carotene hydroxylase